MDNRCAFLFNLKNKTVVIIPLKTIKVKAVKAEFEYNYKISDAIDIWDNKINLEERTHKLKRYFVAYRMGDGSIIRILDEFIHRGGNY